MAYMVEKRMEYRILIGKQMEKVIGRPRHRWH